MKNILIKIFLYVCAFSAISQSIVFLMVYLNYFPLDKVISFYSFITRAPYALNTILIFSITFMIFGFTLLLLAIFRQNTKVKSIEIDGASIIVDAIKDYINQLLKQDPLLTNFNTSISKKGKMVNINITTFFTETTSVTEATRKIREELTEEINKVFNLPYFKINFKIKGLDLNKIEPELPVSAPVMEKEQEIGSDQILNSDDFNIIEKDA